MKPNKTIKAILFSGLAFTAIYCSKPDKTGSLSVQMTEHNAVYDSINVEITGLQIDYADPTSEHSNWIDVPMEQGNYDLLIVEDGITTILTSEEEVPAGKLTQMRLLLGTNNYVIDQGKKYPLELPNQDDNGLKINLNAMINDQEEIDVLFDFDADKSIILTGEGNYKLKPELAIDEVIYQ